MIHEVPALEQIDSEVVAMVHEQRTLLRHQVNQNPVRWTGFLRRNTFARAVQGSNSIEGYDANLAEAIEIIDDAKPETVEEETVRALVGYRNAMTYILRVHDDPHAAVNQEFIRGLHFIMVGYDLTKLPGQWRSGPIYVIREPSNEKVYEGADYREIPLLTGELVDQMNAESGIDAMVRGALAHLNLTMIHPFKDGNGRMARAVQTLLLARDGVLSPVFCSIEEWLGRNTQAYYDVLSLVGQGSWQPKNNAMPWVRFCLLAHYQQAATLIKRNQEVGKTWGEIMEILKRHGLPERCETPLMDAAFGYKVRNNRYRQEHQISDVVASRDLRRLCELNLLKPIGEKRGRYYVAAKKLQELRERHRELSRADNPYELLKTKRPDIPQAQLSRPGLA
jgi:Fic family protein